MRFGRLVLVWSSIAGLGWAGDAVPVANGVPTTLPTAEIDRAMIRCLSDVGCTAGSLAISSHGALVLSRGYGWMNAARTIPAPATVVMGIASCEKSLTAAAVKKVFRDKRLPLDTPLLSIFDPRHAWRVGDPRMLRVTVQHVLDHTAGWGPDPAGALQIDYHQSPQLLPQVLQAVVAGTLSHDPGTKEDYCNFGYDLLRFLIPMATKRECVVYCSSDLLQGAAFYGNADARLPRGQVVDNLVDGGPVACNAPSLCAFMERYWYGGDVRDGGNPLWIRYGSLPGSTAIMYWHPSGRNLVILFNGRSAFTNEAVQQAVLPAVERAW